MKKQLLFACFILFSVFDSLSQCDKSYFIFSPSVCKYGKSKLGVNAEIGFLPTASKAFLTIKGSLFTQTKKQQTTQDTVPMETLYSNSFVALKVHYVPHAFESMPRKWSFGVAGGIYNETEHSRQAAAELSSAYIIRIPAGRYDNGAGYVKIEGHCLLMANAVKPGISVGVLLLF